MSTSKGASARTVPPYEEILTLACRAPSIHNTQPWFWRIHRDEEGLDLLADHSRRLMHADPDERNLMISCGAALHHLQVVAAGLGWQAMVRRLPDRSEPGVLASVVLEPSELSLAAARRLHSVTVRQTDRRRFTRARVSEELLKRLARQGTEWGAQVLPAAPESVAELLRLNARADERQRADEGYLAEIAAWTRYRRGEGVRSEALPRHDRETALSDPGGRFPDGELDEAVPSRDQARSSALLLVSSSSDDTLSRLRAGEAMSEVWLRATEEDLSVVPLSQCIEVPETREQVIARMLDDRALPQILLQVGRLPLTRPPLPRSPRRPIGDVIVRG
jgi:nitroreductase